MSIPISLFVRLLGKREGTEMVYRPSHDERSLADVGVTENDDFVGVRPFI